MEPKITRHTSANLEELNEKIARLLKDPAEALDNASIDVDSMSLAELKAFAEKGMFPTTIQDCDIDQVKKYIGGLGACVSKVDILANTPEELMYLQGLCTQAF